MLNTERLVEGAEMLSSSLPGPELEISQGLSVSSAAHHGGVHQVLKLYYILHIIVGLRN